MHDPGPTAVPIVSVILATYNWTSVLRLAVQSVLAQSFSDFELLVVGDGCTDDSEEVVASFGDPRIRWHNLPHNTGNQAGPNNAGLSMARGEFIAYMHQDDLWFPDHLALLLSGIRNGTNPLAHTLALDVSPPPDHLRRIVGLPSAWGTYGPDRREIWTPTMMHRTDHARALGGWRDWREIQLTPVADFIYRMIGAESKFTTVNAITVVKFHSAQRLGSYVSKPCGEQASYLHEIMRDPDGFRYRELIAAADCVARGKYETRTIPMPTGKEPVGWEIVELNKARGLLPGYAPPVSKSEAPAQPGRKKSLSRRVRNLAGRILIRVRSSIFQNDIQHTYQYYVDINTDTAAARLIRMVGNNKRILEIGAGPGSITRHLKQTNNCDITALEFDASAIPSLTSFCNKVYKSDLNNKDWADVLGNEPKFEVIVAADVLEHLYDPLATLKRMVQLLDTDGALVVSLPHIGHAAIHACLFTGNFQYSDWGLLDKAHIRFFGIENIQTLLEAAGLKIIHAEFVVRRPDETEFADIWNKIPASLRSALTENPFSLVYQVVLKAIPVNAPGKPLTLRAIQPPVPHAQPFYANVIRLIKRIARRYLSRSARARLRHFMQKVGIKV